MVYMGDLGSGDVYGVTDRILKRSISFRKKVSDQTDGTVRRGNQNFYSFFGSIPPLQMNETKMSGLAHY